MLRTLQALPIAPSRPVTSPVLAARPLLAPVEGVLLLLLPARRGVLLLLLPAGRAAEGPAPWPAAGGAGRCG